MKPDERQTCEEVTKLSNQTATCKADAEEEDDVEASVPDEPSIRVNCFALRLFASTTCDDCLLFFLFYFIINIILIIRLFASTTCHVIGNCEKEINSTCSFIQYNIDRIKVNNAFQKLPVMMMTIQQLKP